MPEQTAMQQHIAYLKEMKSRHKSGSQYSQNLERAINKATELLEVERRQYELFLAWWNGKGDKYRSETLIEDAVKDFFNNTYKQ